MKQYLNTYLEINMSIEEKIQELENAITIYIDDEITPM